MIASSRGSAKSSIGTCIKCFLRGDSGATAIEYALIACGVAVAIASTVFSVGTSVNTMFSSVAAGVK